MMNLKIKHYVSRLLLYPVMSLALISCATTNTVTGEIKKIDIFQQIKLADQAYEKGQWIEAERHYQIVIKRAPKDFYAWFRLGNAQLQQGELRRAIHAYESALQRDSTQIRVHYNLATAYLLQAQKSLQSAYQKLPKNDAALEQIAQKLIQLKKLAYTPVEEVISPAKNLIETREATKKTIQ